MSGQYRDYPKHLIRKLPRYYRYLNEQKQFGKEYISSNELASLMGISPSQVRQDFNRFLYNGYHGVGYNVSAILEQITELLDLKTKKNTIIIGAGNLGQSLSNYDELKNCGFEIKAFFDINPRLAGAVINGIKVCDMEWLEEYIKAENIVAAILALPTEGTSEIARKISEYGVTMFLNFNPVFFEFERDVFIENVHIDDNLMMLSYKGAHKGAGERDDEE
ncbi:redox-sensing transcriptional repressor Rex [Christensenella tenuis]|jgi:redox-sensing transcriptional repressor|uniref:Redox-sensing transcriptional repressor Rex n=1 Tax=Christensenella tenuis TaxID=2763033 RepID=A0ABR7EHJ2_9FIRM|nr:redox-sensing transcriptional repressor Rex [Christensenella tenuis]MBC5649242.1 redox-sensing transcriptional repressor Rex [Christensenella tenuis]